MYIRQKQTVQTVNDNDEKVMVEIVIDTSDYKGDLKTHPALTEHPEAYELAEGEQPDNCCLCQYVSENDTAQLAQ